MPEQLTQILQIGPARIVPDGVIGNRPCYARLHPHEPQTSFGYLLELLSIGVPAVLYVADEQEKAATEQALTEHWLGQFCEVQVAKPS